MAVCVIEYILNVFDDSRLGLKHPNFLRSRVRRSRNTMHVISGGAPKIEAFVRPFVWRYLCFTELVSIPIQLHTSEQQPLGN